MPIARAAGMCTSAIKQLAMEGFHKNCRACLSAVVEESIHTQWEFCRCQTIDWEPMSRLFIGFQVGSRAVRREQWKEQSSVDAPFTPESNLI
ncbi:hypothetical protein CDAR_442701 [Caerostris darwini]|uniref:Uncharacterized protein n=1 Tax=Caerostris darwini TaxID=1538125 RepID=A0AAV4VPL8_9ARAC|nr:hypothetical protein CDAR_442701 [Caerostris darwini]